MGQATVVDSDILSLVQRGSTPGSGRSPGDGSNTATETVDAASDAADARLWSLDELRDLDSPLRAVGREQLLAAIDSVGPA